jgi:hypothetical protein
MAKSQVAVVIAGATVFVVYAGEEYDWVIYEIFSTQAKADEYIAHQEYKGLSVESYKVDRA